MPPKKKPNERKKRELERQKKQIKRNNKPDIKCCSVSSFANINPVNHNSTDSRVPEEIITAESTSVDCAETSFQLDDGIGVQVHKYFEDQRKRKEQKQRYILKRRNDSLYAKREQIENRERKRIERSNPWKRYAEAKKDKERRKKYRKQPSKKNLENARETPCKKLKRKNPLYRETEAQQDKERRKNYRDQPGIKDHENARETPCKRQKRNDPSFRETEAQQDKKRRKNYRDQPGIKDHENARETPCKRQKRNDPSFRETEAQQDKERRKNYRDQPGIKDHENARETPCKRQKRNDPLYRETEAQQDKKHKKNYRDQPGIRDLKNARETPCKRQKRNDPLYRETEAQQDKERRKNYRDQSGIKDHENARETPCKRQKRNDPLYRDTEAQQDKERRKNYREQPGIKDHENARETPCKRQKRNDPLYRGTEAQQDKERRKNYREQPGIKDHENARETPCKRQKRNDPSYRGTEAQQDKERRKNYRDQPGIKDHENARETPQRYHHRNSQFNADVAVETFLSRIQEGPVFTCTCCHRLLYRSSLSLFNEDEFSNTDEDLLSKCRTSKISFDMNEYICSFCKRFLKKNELPSLAVCNNLQLDDTPQVLKDLNALEVSFVAKRIPFMKLLALPRGKQKSVHGCVVNIPVEPEQTVSVLPRVPSSASMIMVKLKRKLHYRGHVFLQNIQPQRVLHALHTLRSINPLYSDITVDPEWMQNSSLDSPELWDSLSSPLEKSSQESSSVNVIPLTTPVIHPSTSTGDTTEYDYDENEEENERSRLSGIPYNTCIQPKDLSSEDNIILSIAPGEGKKPKGFDDDKFSEQLSFPHLFPTGMFGYTMSREKKISIKKYFQSRLLNADGRFAKSIEYIFYAQYRCEAEDVKSCLSIALRKGRQTEITAGDVREKLNNFVRGDLGIHFLQKVRGSPAYFNKMFYDLLGMIRQLGPCTWFLTLSAADLKWTDTIKVLAQQQGKDLSDEDIENLSWEERCDFLRSNPVTAARHFDNRVQLFLKYILLNKQLNPLGNITDYKYRIEFQQRGSPHVHMVAWVDNAPSIENNSLQEVKMFIENHISCELPENDDHLHRLLCTVQKHTHSVACKKHGQKCRFHFPRPPLKQTIVAKPPSEPPPASVQEQYSAVLTAVQEELAKLKPDEKISLDELLQRASVSETLYEKALIWISTKNGQPAVLLKRTPAEVNINNYNRHLMLAWQANLDVQFVTNTYACVMYVASYVSKPEKTLGDILKAVSASGEHLGPKTSMKSVAKKFLTHREVSAQEAIYRLMSLPLVQGSRQIVFVPTDLPEQRTRLFKPLKLLQMLEDDDADVFMTGILEYYAARPSKLSEMTLAEFASKYKKSSNKTLDKSDEKKIQLQGGFGVMSQRGTPAIIRYHQWSEKKQPSQYYHSQLLLYCPWRDEKNDLCYSSYEETYNANKELIEENRKSYEYHSSEIQRAVENIEEFGIAEECWNILAPQAEQMQCEDRRTGTTEVPTISNVFDHNSSSSVNHDLGLVPYEVEFSNERMTKFEWYNHLLSLNTLQSQVHDFIVHWCTKMLLSHKCRTPDPFHIFLTGGAGVGKSHLVRAIVQTINHFFQRNNQVQDMHVMVCAPTGAAAYNISGYTLHAAFLLPVNVKSSDDYIPLSGERLASLKESIGNIKVLIIDEISMVGSDMLLTVHRRLCDVMGNHQPFGGISILAVGDLLQLPPVAQKPVFSCPSDEMAAIYGSLWQHFQIAELHEIQRQKNDSTFALLLNRIRSGTHTDEDIKVLQQRAINESYEDYPKDATHIFAYNKDVYQHNMQRLESIQTSKFTFTAEDSKKDGETVLVETTNLKEMAGGLAKTISIAVGAKVMLTKNLDVQDGLVNSASGVVTGFYPQPAYDQDRDTFKPKYIFVKFNDERVGKRNRLQSSRILIDEISTPIPQVETQIRFGKHSKVTAKRTQFPLCLAWAVTIHKEQGKTEDQLVVSCKGTFHAGQFYTAVSRTKELKGLLMLGDVTSNKVKVNTKALEEIRRMKESSLFQPCQLQTTALAVTMDSFFIIHCLNINSFLPHEKSFNKDCLTMSSHITCLVETWLRSTDEISVTRDYSQLRADSNQQHRNGGLLSYIHHNLHLLKYFKVEVRTEHNILLLAPKQDPSLRICAVLLYHNPKRTMTVTKFLEDLEVILSHCPQGLPSFLLGDFNIDLSLNTTSAKHLQNLMKYYGFRPCVSEPTHRQGGHLDNIFTNILFTPLLDVIPKYYTDHMFLSLAVPWTQFYQ